MFLGKAGCLGETQPPRSLADHYATAANPADSSRDKNLIQPGGSFDAFLSLLSQENFPKIDPAHFSWQQTLLAKNLWGWISRLHALNTLAGHSHKF